MKFFLLNIFLLGFLSSLYSQDSLVLKITDDVQIGFHDNYPNSFIGNYPDAVYIASFSQPGAIGGLNNGEGIFNFNFKEIADTQNIESIKLYLFGSGPIGVGEAASVGDTGINNCFIKRITNQWTLSNLSWNNKPAYSSMNEVQTSMSNQPIQDYIVNIKNLTLDAIADTLNSFGFVLTLQDMNPSKCLAFFSSNYSDSTKRPYVIVKYKKHDFINRTDKIIQTQFISNHLRILNNISSEVTIDVFDIRGINVSTIRNLFHNSDYDFSFLHSGFYIYSVSIDSKTQTGSFIIE